LNVTDFLHHFQDCPIVFVGWINDRWKHVVTLPFNSYVSSYWSWRIAIKNIDEIVNAWFKFESCSEPLDKFINLGICVPWEFGIGLELLKHYCVNWNLHSHPKFLVHVVCKPHCLQHSHP
jgi:hypothetical protein